MQRNEISTNETSSILSNVSEYDMGRKKLEVIIKVRIIISIINLI